MNIDQEQYLPPLVKVVLKDELGEKFGHEHYFRLTSARDAIAALSANYPDFKAYLLEQQEQGIGYQMITPRHPEGLVEESLDDRVYGELIIIPVIAGSGASGRVILGAVLIAASVIISFPTAGGGTALGLLGASLVLSGVSEWLTPATPLTRNKAKEESMSSSISLSNPIASKDQPIPLLYGEQRVRLTKVISAGVTTDDIDVD